jgi:uncharacterized membrane protein YsdA (DUF1294 family)
MATSGTIICVALITLNVVTFAVFGWDKFSAASGRRRVSERALLSLMVVGGSPGGWAAMFVFHHKTQKASFRWLAIIIVLLQVATLIAVSSWLVGK